MITTFIIVYFDNNQFEIIRYRNFVLTLLLAFDLLASHCWRRFLYVWFAFTENSVQLLVNLK